MGKGVKRLIFMKILLIAANIAKTPYPVFPLGMAMVAGALERAGHDVVLFDFLQNELSLISLSTFFKKVNPDFVGISIRNIDNVNLMNEKKYLFILKEIIDEIRKISDVKIALGGSAFSILPDIILENTGADYGFIGEGEKLFVDFIADFEKGIFPENKILASIPSLSCSDIPSANYDSHLMSFYLNKGGIANLQTKRGCSHNCVYCSYPALEGHKIRCRKPKDVVDDILNIVTHHNAKMIFFTDSVFNDDDGNYIEVLQEMENRNVSVPWTAFIKPELFDNKIIRLMKNTGLKAVELGSDAPTDTTLKGLGKSFGFDEIRECSSLFAKNKIAVAHYFMFGGPGETKETVYQGIENLISLKDSVSFIFMGIRILPNTILEKIAVEKGIIKPLQNLLNPVYYIEPEIERDWLEETLTDKFKGIRHCIFPPDALENSVQFLHKLNHTGVLWDMLIPGNNKSFRRIRKRK